MQMPKEITMAVSTDVSILERKELLVQPLATVATGKAKKYERTGPKEFVAFPYEELAIPNIIRAYASPHHQKNWTFESTAKAVLASGVCRVRMRF